MARPNKQNADYFSHDNDMRNNDKIKAVRKKFGLIGYAIWNMILEKLCKADYFTLIYSDINIELRAGDFDVSNIELINMIDYFVLLGLLIKDSDKIYSKKLIERLQPMLDKREKMKQKYTSKLVSASETQEKSILNSVSSSETTESKGKENKEKESVSNNKGESTQSHTPNSFSKIEYIAKLRDAQTRGRDYIEVREKIIGRKIVLCDDLWIKIGSLIQQFDLNFFTEIVQKYKKISDFSQSKTKYIYEGYKSIDTYTFEQFIQKFEMFTLEDSKIIQKIQNHEFGNKLLEYWNKQFIPPKEAISKIVIPENIMTTEEKTRAFQSFKTKKEGIFKKL